MPLPAFRRAWSREEKREARQFLLDHPVAAEGTVGCSEDAPLTNEIIARASVHWEFITTWLDGQLAAVHAWMPSNDADEWDITICVAALDPAWDPEALYYVMLVGANELLPWGENHKWCAQIPAEAVPLVSTTIDGVQYGPDGGVLTVTDSQVPGFKTVIGTRPDPAPSLISVEPS